MGDKQVHTELQLCIVCNMPVTNQSHLGRARLTCSPECKLARGRERTAICRAIQVAKRKRDQDDIPEGAGKYLTDI